MMKVDPLTTSGVSHELVRIVHEAAANEHPVHEEEPASPHLDPEVAACIHLISEQHGEILKRFSDKQDVALHQCIQECRWELKKKVGALVHTMRQRHSHVVHHQQHHHPDGEQQQQSQQVRTDIGSGAPAAPVAAGAQQQILLNGTLQPPPTARGRQQVARGDTTSRGLDGITTEEDSAQSAYPSQITPQLQPTSGPRTANTSGGAASNGAALNVGRSMNAGSWNLEQRLGREAIAARLKDNWERTSLEDEEDAAEIAASQREHFLSKIPILNRIMIPQHKLFALMDAFVGVFVTASALIYFIQLLWEGYKSNVSLGLVQDGGWEGAEEFFLVSEFFFNGFFLAEMLFRIKLFKAAFFWRPFNWFDSLVVIVSAVETFILRTMLDLSTADVNFVRLLRFMRLARTVRIVRVLNMFQPLRVLLKTIYSSLMSLVWCMLVLGLLQCLFAMIMCQTLTGYIQDEANSLQMRMWANRHYGSSSKAFWTMFEFTFSGGWPTYARPVVEEISPVFSILFGCYVTFVIFAIIRIINALFLQETLKVASADLEMQAQMCMTEKQAYISKLRSVFQEIDTDKSGFITLDEFNAVFTDPKVKAIMGLLGLEVHEVSGLYELLDDGDGQITYEEFVNGIIILKGQARSQDVIAILHDSRKILRMCSDIYTQICTTSGLSDASVSEISM